MSAFARMTAALRSDAVSGSLLIGAAVVALVWANSPLSPAYESLRSFTFGPTSLHVNLPLHAWTSDGLLTLFFFIVGNELKREIVHGALRHPRHAILPIVAALSGVLIPVAVFVAVNVLRSQPISGWGVPMATDAAFAVAVLAVVGRHLPSPLRTFLLTMATVDDMCAVIIIAVSHTAGLAPVALGGTVLGLAVFGYLQNSRSCAGVPRWVVYGPLAAGIWTLTHASGVHATIAGVAMGTLMRTTPRPGEPVSPSHRAEIALRPVVAGLALPAFALMSAGISLEGAGGIWSSTITWGILGGLIGGKAVGIFGGTWLTARITRAELNPGLSWPDIAGIGLLGGIGFTVSLLISELSFTDATTLGNAKGAVLLASAIAAVLAALLLGVRDRHHRRNVETHAATCHRCTDIHSHK
ncbi:Na+/H+ antiporter NhaA [Planotetraspora kaengkrachanensis]|uniref:Na(+)/H(+) antiporter NhaA n=1 Tax=Planotetraspora kaengkrachanensis TaxID=575193 RepID=A0A8J3PWQ9_9ACTN|nr:Na+/H+ antiporter NhaA [Planotetraspora kaengkrachanensis]GIG82524.1 Na+/H+ antiporter [Planotetraspora kaengkrachanensis]